MTAPDAGARHDALSLAEKLMRAEEIRLMPELLRPVSKAEIARFLRDQARRLSVSSQP